MQYKQPFNSPILPAKCDKRALSRLLMSPITSPNDHSPVKPPCLNEFNKTIEDSDSDVDNAECIINDAIMLIDEINNERILVRSCRPEFMEKDGTYDHNIEIPLTFTCTAEPESTCNVNKYIKKGPVVKTNVLNHFKDMLEACAVAGGLNQELISHLTFQSNENAHGKLDHTKGMFVGYKWTNITISEMY